MIRPRLIAFAAFAALPVGVFLQSTLLANVLPGGVTPNFAFLCTATAGFTGGAALGAGCGMWSGALLGAAAGSLAAPLACLYGLLGWLAGLHREREPYRWTYPLAAVSLAALAVSGESLVSLALEGYEPSLFWKLLNVAWCGVLGLPLWGLWGRRSKKK